MSSCQFCGSDCQGHDPCPICGRPQPASIPPESDRPAGPLPLLGLVDFDRRPTVPPSPPMLLLPPPPAPPVDGKRIPLPAPDPFAHTAIRRPRPRTNRRFTRFFSVVAGVTLAAALASVIVPRIARESSAPSRALARVAPSAVSHSPHALLPTDHPPLSGEAAYLTWMLAHTGQSDRYLRERWKMVQRALTSGAVTHRSVETALLETPREWFFRPYDLPVAYAPTSLPIGYGQTQPRPELEARMVDALDVQPGQRVLEVGNGVGYLAAVLSALTPHVYRVAGIKALADRAEGVYHARAEELPALARIRLRVGDPASGWQEEAPFDRIVVTAGVEHLPAALLRQLKPGGIMIVPLGTADSQRLMRVTKEVGVHGRVRPVRRAIYPESVDFKPLSRPGGIHP